MRHAAAVSMQHAVSRQHAACSYWPSISLFCISICTDTCYCVSIRTTATRLHGYTAHGARRTTLTLAHDVRCAGGFNAGPDASASIANMGYESGLYVRTSLCLGVQADVCEADVCGRVCRRVALPMRNLLRSQIHINLPSPSRTARRPPFFWSVYLLVYPRHFVCVAVLSLQANDLPHHSNVQAVHPEGGLGWNGQHVAAGAEHSLDCS